MTKEEVIEAHQNFLKKYDDEEMPREDFIGECEVHVTMDDMNLFVTILKDTLIGQAVFKVFDKDDSGTMDFVEYMQAKNALSLNSVDDKLEWIFCLFDSDGGGSVDLREIEVHTNNQTNKDNNNSGDSEEYHRIFWDED